MSREEFNFSGVMRTEHLAELISRSSIQENWVELTL